MNKNLYEAMEGRRSIYALGREPVVSEKRVREIVEFAVKHTPSPFNSQSSRTVVLFGKESNKLWNIVAETLRKIVPAEAFTATRDKLAAFDAGLGTVLFFEDQAVVNDLASRFALYKDHFPVWSLQSNGMLEFAVWMALESEGLGASLQHYNPLIDGAVRAEWKLPDSWKLLAEMPFGSVTAPAGQKEFNPISERVRVFGQGE
jgi:predicted oxidoreductase (fatty acid repression mutant protein)